MIPPLPDGDDFCNVLARTRHGQAAFVARKGCFDRGQIAIMIHGFGRSPNRLLDWQDRLPFELLFARLPGYGTTFKRNDLEGWIDGFKESIQVLPKRPALMVGESLGGLIALGCGVPAVAVEPFLTSDRLWPVQKAIGTAREKNLYVSDELVANFFGGTRHDVVLERIDAPSIVVGGTNPLMPPRHTKQSVRLLEDDDFQEFDRHPLVEAVRVEGGHLLLSENPLACENIIKRHAKKYVGASSA